MVILICGDRNWNDYSMIKGFVDSLPAVPKPFLIEGEAKGADLMSAKAFEERGWADNIKRFPADWNQHGRAAGPIRNRQQFKEGKPDIVIAYHNDIKNSKGTKDMATVSIKAGKPTYLNAKSIEEIQLGLIEQLTLEDLK